ncbi:RNA polymerase subunit sigma-70 [Lewinellaceae bacterium SD302]|nr:RNA polymerase subunit sigma-70 [Lewinellaceae bacterium SD302]
MLRFLRTGASRRSSEVDDATLLARFQRSHKAEDLSPLFNRHLELIYGQCLRYLRAPERAEDAAMEIFEHLLRKLPGQSIDNFRNWLQSVVRNFCLMQLRKDKRDPLKNSGELLVHSEPFEHPVGELEEEKDEQSQHLADCLGELAEQQRQCIQRFYLEEGQTYKSIAATLELDVGRVRSYIQNGRRNLRNCIESKKSFH